MAEFLVVAFSVAPEPSHQKTLLLNAEYALTGGRLLCSKVGLMEEDHSLQVLVPMRNPATGVVLQ